MRLGRASAGVFLSNGLTLVLSFGNSIFLTRTLGVVGKGEFAVFSASFGILSLLLGFGLDVSLRYHVAKDEVPRDRILTTLMAFVLGASALVLGVVHLNHTLFSNEFFLPTGKQTLGYEAILAAVVGVTLFYSSIASVFAGDRSFTVLNWATIGFSAISFAVYGGLFMAESSGRLEIGAGEIFAIYLGLQVFNAIVLGVLAYRRLGVRPSFRFLDSGLVGDMLRYASLAYFANLVQFLNYRVDIWFVQSMEGSAALGLYSLAANLAMMLWILPRSVSTVLLPAMAAKDEGASMEHAARLSRLILFASVALGLPLALTASNWITFLYGAEFSAAGTPFALLLVGCVPFVVCVIQAGALAGMDRQDVNLTASSVGLVLTIALDLLLIPRYGIEGAAVASAVSYLGTTLYVAVVFARIGGLPIRSAVLPTVADVRYAIDGIRSLLR